jgi:signal transduction histidine kinase
MSWDKAAYDVLPDGVVIADADQVVVVVNPAAARLLRRSADQCVGRPLSDVLPLQDAEGRDWWACTDPYGGLASRTRQPERMLQLPDGRHLLVTASYVRDADELSTVQALVVALRDTRARDRQERERAELISIMAHDLRSPLASVKGFTATLLRAWERFGDDQKKQMLETVNADADRMTRLIGDLLDVSRIDAGRLEIRPQVVDLVELARTAVAGRSAADDAHERRFDVVVEGELPETWADPDKVAQILGNLLENAVRHGDGAVTVTLAPDPAGNGTFIRVADEGSGIPAGAEQRVFLKFWRAGTGRGTGLGLFIVRGLTEAHRGRVHVGSSHAGGAEFSVFLPANTPDFI